MVMMEIRRMDQWSYVTGSQPVKNVAKQNKNKKENDTKNRKKDDDNKDGDGHVNEYA